jgi:hypothetical protein
VAAGALAYIGAVRQVRFQERAHEVRALAYRFRLPRVVEEHYEQVVRACAAAQAQLAAFRSGKVSVAITSFRLVHLSLAAAQAERRQGRVPADAAPEGSLTDRIAGADAAIRAASIQATAAAGALAAGPWLLLGPSAWHAAASPFRLAEQWEYGGSRS